jgi:hypothetical protein
MLHSFLIIYGASLLLPLAVLAAAFVYARLHSDGPLDLVSGGSAYLAIMTAGAAVLIAIGSAQVLTAILADLNEGFTYGGDPVLGGPFGAPGPPSNADRQDADLSGGLGLALVGVALATLHIWLRGRLTVLSGLDTGVERAVEVLAALVFGLVVLVLTASAVAALIERLSYGEDAGAPGEPLAFALAFAAVWLIYGARCLIALTAPPEAEAAMDESLS